MRVKRVWVGSVPVVRGPWSRESSRGVGRPPRLAGGVACAGGRSITNVFSAILKHDSTLTPGHRQVKGEVRQGVSGEWRWARLVGRSSCWQASPEARGLLLDGAKALRDGLFLPLVVEGIGLGDLFALILQRPRLCLKPLPLEVPLLVRTQRLGCGCSRVELGVNLHRDATRERVKAARSILLLLSGLAHRRTQRAVRGHGDRPLVGSSRTKGVRQTAGKQNSMFQMWSCVSK